MTACAHVPTLLCHRPPSVAPTCRTPPLLRHPAKYTKNPKLQTLQNLQNMNYGTYIYIYNKLILEVFFNFQKITKHRKYFGMLVVFCTINRYFEHSIRIL